MNCNKHVDKPLQNKIKTLKLLGLQVKAMVTTIIFQIAVCSNAWIQATYFVYDGKQWVLLFEMLETVFEPHIENVGSATPKSAIIEKDSKVSKVLIIVLVPTTYSIVVSWICLPFIFWYIEVYGGTDIDHEHSGDY
jgi:hypothetical protein